MKTTLLAFVFCLFSISCFAQDELRDNATGIAFPQSVSFEHDGKKYDLQATGVATRKKLIINVYSVAHYLEDKAKSMPDKIAEIMSDQNAKQLTMKWARSVDSRRVQDGYHESFQKALSQDELSQLQNEINQYIEFFSHDVQKGDEHVLRWIPEGYIEVLINGNRVGNINNKAFARALWSIWFGQNSVVNRNNLISLMH